MKRILAHLTFLASAALAIPAGAVVTTWSAVDDTVGTCDGSTSTCLLTDTANGQTTVKFRAYSVGAWQGSNAPGPLSGSWIAAQNELFNSGYGVRNNIQQALSEELNEPQNATDNREVVDIMIIELPPGQAWNPKTFVLGYARTINADGTGGAGTSAGVSTFIGNLSPNYDFDANNVCFDTAGGTCSASQMGLISQLGFQDITSAIQFGGSAVQQNQTTIINTNFSGNVLVITGRLGEGDDAFNIQSISAITAPVPEPHVYVMMLAGIGLVGWASRRRKQKTA
jgi:hypothetical protein